ncbi:MAG: ATP-binding cassette domain-containing protein, partial [Chloroflexi bacterium]|nr:ATP-binding cassette domain-containing protein [Chloroflexota bacterium]
HEFIISLPNGYDTMVGERGITLSGGQRQRLAIARTVLLDPPILVLDDSTSSVDTETEHLIRAALAEVMKGRTTFVIAHRLSTVKNAHMIVVLKEGQIVQQGTHQELVNQPGPYQEIYELQLRPQDQEALLAAQNGAHARNGDAPQDVPQPGAAPHNGAQHGSPSSAGRTASPGPVQTRREP